MSVVIYISGLTHTVSHIPTDILFQCFEYFLLLCQGEDRLSWLQVQQGMCPELERPTVEPLVVQWLIEGEDNGLTGHLCCQ